ncbi:hypothetical protein V6N13_044436 [Hibiscus sabdariffa]
MFRVAVQAVRMNYYPPCSRPDLVLGLSPHSDGTALTVLQQGKDRSVGLQILKGQTWLPVQPIPDALVINIPEPRLCFWLIVTLLRTMFKCQF